LKIENNFEVAAPRQRVWEFIRSAKDVGACIPGCEHVEVVGDGKFKARVRVRMGPIKALFNFDVERLEEREPEYSHYATRGEEGGRASRLHAKSKLSLQALDSRRTKVAYASDISIAGRLGRFGVGMMRKKAADIGAQFEQAVRKRLNARDA